MGEALIDAKERNGIVRIQITVKEGNQIMGISIPLDELNPLAIPELLEKYDLVVATREAKDVLNKYLEGWL